MLESHVSGHMVKKEITQEGEVSGATIQNNDAEINHCLLSDCLLWTKDKNLTFLYFYQIQLVKLFYSF